MKKTEWNEGSAARKETVAKRKDGTGDAAARKAGGRKLLRNGQADFTAQVLHDAIQGIINNQVP